jgi:protein phosphatase
LQQAQMSPFRNIITRSIGTQPSVEPDFFSVDLQEGDRILICSDGLTGHLEPEDIVRLAGSSAAIAAGPSVTAMRLVEVANERGGRDNITVLILDILEIERQENTQEIDPAQAEQLTLVDDDAEESVSSDGVDSDLDRSLYGSVI